MEMKDRRAAMSLSVTLLTFSTSRSRQVIGLQMQFLRIKVKEAALEVKITIKHQMRMLKPPHRLAKLARLTQIILNQGLQQLPNRLKRLGLLGLTTHLLAGLLREED
jgi:hypothetical protein